MSDKEKLAREDLAKIIRGALVENWSCYETASKWDEDVLLTGCKKVGNGQGYLDPEQAAQNLALDAADAILSALRASTQGGEEIEKAIRAHREECWVQAIKAGQEGATASEILGALDKADADLFAALSSAPSIRDQVIEECARALREAEKDLVAYQRNATLATRRDFRWEGVAGTVQPTIDLIRSAIRSLSTKPTAGECTNPLRAALEKASAALMVVCDDDKRPIKFIGAWKHLGETTIGAILDEADAALSTKPTAGEGWRTDLENAPKDEDPILIAINGVKLPWNDTDVIVRQARFRPGGAWITDFDAYYPKDIIGWMPLPPAPAAPAKGEDA